MLRELEGALNKVVAISRFKGTPIDLDVVRESLKDVLAIRARTISTENIQRVVSEYFRIPLKELVGPKTDPYLCTATSIGHGACT